MTDETRDLLLHLLDAVTLSGADPDLQEKAERIANARAELTAD